MIPLAQAPKVYCRDFDHERYKHDAQRIMEKVNKAKTEEELDPEWMAKMFGDIKSLQKDVRTISTLAAKLSTTGVIRMEGGDDSSKPVAFTITDPQRVVLLREAQELARNENTKETTYVDIIAEFLVSTFSKRLPTSVQ